MIRVQSRPLRLVAAGLTLAVLGAACGTPEKKNPARGSVAETTATTVAKGPDTTAAQLRSSLTALLQEHVYLAAAVAASRSRADETAAAQAALSGNTDSLAANMTAIFTGDDANAKVAEQFAQLWKAGVAQNAGNLGALFSSALTSLPADTVAGPLSAAEQGVGNGTNFTALRSSASQMVTLGSNLTRAVHQKYPDKVGGDPASKAADLLANLNAGLQEHVFLAAAATNGALGGRADEFTAAKAALDANSDAISNLVGTVYGAEAGKAFAPLWKKHIDFLVDYTNAVAAKDQAKADDAMDSLLGYTEEFGAFINTASPKLAKDAVADLVKTHVLTLKDVIDAQAAKNFAKAYGNVRTAAGHMSMIATGLATTIVAQFPQNF